MQSANQRQAGRIVCGADQAEELGTGGALLRKAVIISTDAWSVASEMVKILMGSFFPSWG